MIASLLNLSSSILPSAQIVLVMLKPTVTDCFRVLALEFNFHIFAVSQTNNLYVLRIETTGGHQIQPDSFSSLILD